MGVKDLWPILDPVKKNKPLQDLTGQILAVDLSIWMCDTQQLQHVVHKPYLRNIFFRIVNLMQLGVKPVFVVDGTPPELKWKTIQMRLGTKHCDLARQRPNARITHRGTGSHTSHKMTRSRFKRLAQECCEMFDALGIPYIQSVGEAEAMCAMLNAEGLVDACITNDGDAFLYGAKTVYRNFTLNNKDPHVEVYSMEDIERYLHLDRERLVALALLLGCDYLPKGVPGVGKEIAVKLLQELSVKSVLERFKSWSSTSLEHNDDAIKKPAHCGFCGHIGSKRNHDHYGCTCCKTNIQCDANSVYTCTCSWHTVVSHSDAGSVEVMVYKKAMRVPGFPDQKVIDEFLNQKDVIPKDPLMWRRPKPFSFHKFAVDKMEWDGIYTMEKVIPLLTLYDLRALQAGRASSDVLQPHSIIKSRIRQGVPCFEIQWYKLDNDDVTEGAFYITIEEQELVNACFPELVMNYTENQVGKKNKPKGKKLAKSHNDVVENIQNMLPVNLGSLQSTDFSHRNTNPVQGKHPVIYPEEKPSCYSLAAEPPAVKQVITRVEQLRGVNEDRDSNDFLPLSERLAMLTKRTSLKPTKKQTNSQDNQVTLWCPVNYLPEEDCKQLSCKHINSLQSEWRLDSDDRSLRGKTNLCKSINSIPTELMESKGKLQNNCSTKNIKKKKGKKYKQLHSMFDLCSILEQSTIEESLVEEVGEIIPGKMNEQIGGLLNEFDHNPDCQISSCIGKMNNDSVTEFHSSHHNPGYSSTPASFDGIHRILGQDVFSPIGMNLSVNNTSQTTLNEESVNIPCLVTQTASNQLTRCNQQNVCENGSPFEHKTGEVGNFHLQSSVLSDWSLKELGLALDDSGLSMKECDLGVQRVAAECGFYSDTRADHMFLANRHRKSGSSRCKIKIGQHCDDIGVIIEQDLVKRGQNKMHLCESKEDICTRRTLLPVNTQLGMTSSQRCNKADDAPGTSPVLLSLGERLKAKLINSTGRRVLSSLTNENNVK